MEKVINQKKYDVVVVGEINADLILRGNVVPAFGQIEQVIDEADLVMGSSAVIFACGAARLGLRTAFIGKVGDDLFGKFMLESMLSRGIDISCVAVDPKVKTGFSVILSESNDRAILTFPGSIPELQYNEINIDLLCKSRHLHLSSYFLLNNLRPRVPELFRQAKDFGLSISLDTNYDPKEEWDGGLIEALQFVDVFLPNETEARAISKGYDILEVLGSLGQIVSCVAVKLGAAGAMAKCKESDILTVDAFPVEVMDTVGAGDSFDAGFVFGYLNQWDLEQTLRLAVACGSLSTLAAGGTDGQVDLEQALEFISAKREGTRTE